MMLAVHGPPEVLDRLQVLAGEQGYLEVQTPWGLVPVLLAYDDAVLAEADRVLPQYLEPHREGGAPGPLADTQLWLRNAAERAYRKRTGRP
jgi:hypothetical protein